MKNQTMKEVGIIRPISLDLNDITTNIPINTSEPNGFKEGLSKIGLLVFPSIILMMGLLFFMVGVAPDDGEPILWLSLISLLVVFASLLWLRWILKRGTYKPGKSFRLWRLTKKKISLFYTAVAVIAIIICVSLLFVEFKLQLLFWIIVLIIGLYYIKKSFKVHEDVDYTANQELAEILGMDVDEKVQASYLKNDVIFLLTDKKIIFAYKKNRRWKVLNKKIEEISKIGVYTPMMMGSFFNTDLYFLLLFGDSTKVQLKMDLTDNITSNPDLFFKKFLTTLDDVLLGKTDEKIVSRRRVSVNSANTGPKPSESVNDEDTGMRKIDISETVLSHLRDATPIEPGRTLEF